MTYLISDIAKIVKGTWVAFHEDTVIRELLMDSRKAVFPGVSLFFALKGPRRDGHSFIKDAFKKGIRNFIVSEQLPELPGQANVIHVRDVLEALQTLAVYHRNRFHIPVIGITGSNGKTIVKEWLNQLLSDSYNIVRSPKSYNSQIGVPLSVWQLHENATLGIFEAGISQSNEMDNLQKIIQPDIGVFTNIGDAHSKGFLNNRQKIREKLRLFTKVKTLIYCKDFPELNEAVASMYQQLKTGSEKPFNIISWSAFTHAELEIKEIKKEGPVTNIKGRYLSGDVNIAIPFSDDASIQNAINCWCVLLHLEMPADEIKRRMRNIHGMAMRLDLRNGINNSSVINDSYSADLSSLKIALDFLSQQHQHPKRTVILTDFLESGRSEKDLYEDIARSIEQHKVDRLIGIGPVISRNAIAFEKYNKKQLQFFTSVDDFRQQFPHLHFGNETILIKGARVFGLEQINNILERQTHQTLLEIDLDALLFNLKSYQQLLQPKTKLMAMVKAFSYGSGSYEIASALQFNKVDYLAVAYADEGVELRKGGITLPVMVMNPDESSFNTLIAYDLEPEIYSHEQLNSFELFLKNEGLNQYPIHIELETGMNRLGFSKEDLPGLLNKLQSNSFKVQSVFSHLVGSEDPNLDYFTKQQADLFTQMSDEIKEKLDYPFLRHLLNTSGISRHPSLQFDMVRMGIGLYGIDSANVLELKEVSTLKSSVAQIKHVRPGESVSYGRSGMVHRDTWIATVRLGYADGYPRMLGNGRGRMLVNGQLAPTIGNICMDMTMLDITGILDIHEGDEVTVFGKGLPVADVAKWAETIPYEILTGISQRVKRVYFQE
ncbi:MAG: bifunctional UDP-N-acetylmuramoyl-tripeptide:D-alanyl-D-alanine ligase/alanine racemase [Chitinophagaceae bacterium]|nr:bifunctional UDP-N-acetylmuramoyl-tripeptide:D-alanyl-D-alanine ligase/alanine racemase [Chitinophagaceae bacterium]